jgi:hypothetical protein
MEKAIDSLIDITYMSELILDIPKTIARQKCQGLDFHHNLWSACLPAGRIAKLSCMAELTPH